LGVVRGELVLGCLGCDGADGADGGVNPETVRRRGAIGDRRTNLRESQSLRAAAVGAGMWSGPAGAAA
jgi:hypothetical protein